MKYSEILRTNNELKRTLEGTSLFQVANLSNIITAQLNEIFEYIRPLSFAGNRRRPVHLVFLKQKSLLFINLLKEPHIHIRDITT